MADKLDFWLKQHIGDEVFSPGLERLSPYLHELKKELKIRGTKIVTVAGTNGKGETCHDLAHCLNSAHISYALFTSPHIFKLAERFEFNGKLIEEEKLLTMFQNLWRQIQKTKNPLSYYEFLLVIFTQLVVELSPLVCILEVGLGGRLDGVNFFDPDLTAITSISRDHTAILGEKYKQILTEKLGITRPGIPLISSLELSYCQQQVAVWCQDQKIPWQDLFQQNILSSMQNFSQRNQLLAQKLFQELFPSSAIPSIFPSFKSRGESCFWGSTKITFYGSHNLDGLRKLFELLSPLGHTFQKDKAFDFLLFSFSQREEKEIMAMFSVIDRNKFLFKECYATSFEHPKALPQAVYAQEGIKSALDWKEWLEKIKDGHYRLLVTGSYYFVGEVQKFLADHSA